MKEFFTTAICLLRKHKRFGGAIISLAGALICLALFVTLGRHEWIYGAIFLLTIATWEISDAFLLEKQSALQTELLNAKDKLCISEHEAERLKLELDAARAAFKAGERRWGEQAARMKEQADEPEPTTVETAPTEAPKPKPKRRPAPKRKPKQTEIKNENKD